MLSLPVVKCSNMGFRTHSILTMSILRCGKYFFYSYNRSFCSKSNLEKRAYSLQYKKIYKKYKIFFSLQGWG